MRIDLRIDPISPRRRRVSAGLHATDFTVACMASIFSHTQMTTRAGSLVTLSESRAVVNEYEGHKRTLPIISSSFRMAVGVKGLYNAFFMSLLSTLWRRLGRRWPTMNVTYELTSISPRRRRVSAGLHCNRHTVAWHTSIFSHTQMTTRAGSLVYVRVESGRERVRRT